MAEEHRDPPLPTAGAVRSVTTGGQGLVVVVGGGIAGLIAAYELRKRGVRVALLEGADRAGGRARSDVETIGGRRVVIHHGAQMSSRGYRALVPIIEELGLSSHLIENTRLTSILFRGQLVQVDDRNVYSSKGTVLTDGEWWDYGHQALLVWNRRLRGRSVADPAHWLDLESESGASLERDLGKGPARLLNGVVHAFYFQRPEAVSRALPLSLWTTLIDDDAPESLLDGFGMLIDALVERIGDVRLNQKVERVECTPDGVKVTVGGAVLSASDVVIATSADVGRAIYVAPSEAERDLLSVGYVPTFNIALDVDMDWLRHPALAGTYGIRVPVDEMGPEDIIASISIESGRTRRPTPGHETVQIMLDAQQATRLLGQPPEDIGERAIAEAERKKLLPGIATASRNYQAVFEIRSAIPETRPGRFEVICRYEQTISPASRVKFAGDFRGFPRVGSAALSGVAAALETLNARSARARQWVAAISPERSPRRPSTPGDELRDSALGYRAAVARWGESMVRGDLRGASAAWINGWRSFFDGVDAMVRAMGRPGRRP